MKFLVCGSRTFSDQRIVDAVLHGFWETHGMLHIIEGGAKGADVLARQWAEKQIRCHFESVTLATFPADWKTHGRAAGPKRNQQMLDEGKPDLVVAFTDKPLADSKGTADMVRRARAAGIPVYHITSM